MPDCTSCKESRRTVPFIVHEADMARMERTNKRLWIIVIILALMLFGSNIAWVTYENQFTDTVEETYTSEADGGGIAIVNRDGSVNYGESDLHTEKD